jgi:hypothetical protein
MKPPPPPSLGLVAPREIRFFRRDRAGYLLVIFVPLICFAVLTWTFSSAVVCGLNVIVVDTDRSEFSADLIQSIASAPGQPVTTLQRSGERWASLNLREDLLDDLRIGAAVELTPADGTPPMEAKIDETVPRGEFAIWRAARAVGEHDLNTFVLRADPVVHTESALQPGMTVWLHQPGHTRRQ